MKKGNWKSWKSYKRDLAGCHRANAPAGRMPITDWTPSDASCFGAIATRIALALMNPFRRGNR